MNTGLAALIPSAEIIQRLRPSARRDGHWRPALYDKGAPVAWREMEGDRLIVVEAGLVKLSYLTADGNEWIKSFIVDQGLFGSIGGSADSDYHATCIEPSVIVSLPMSWVRDAVSEDIALQRAVTAFWSWLSSRKRDRENTLLCLTATQRYMAFKAEAAGSIGRIPQGDVARYLGITPIAFSRIKRRLRTSLD